MSAPAAVAQSPSAALEDIKDRVIDRTGLAYYADKDGVLAQRIQVRMKALGLETYGDYRAILVSSSNADEWAKLIDEVTVGETFYFRHREQWEALRDLVLPDRLARDERGLLRIWCAGCANGAEPYSLAILLLRDLRSWTSGRDISILATDISAARLSCARIGEYTDWDLRATPEPYKRDCFSPSGSMWRIREPYKSLVGFAELNLAHDMDAFVASNGASFDVIVCRNVLIYLDVELNRRLLRGFHACLKAGGWFVAGHADPFLEICKLFHPVSAAGATIYRKPSPQTDPIRPVADGYLTLPTLSSARPASPRPRPGPHTPSPRPQTARPGALSPLLPPPAAPMQRAKDIRGGRTAEARRYADAGDWHGAAEACQRSLEDDPLDAEARFVFALVLAHLGHAGSAEAEMRRALYLDPHLALAHYHLALAAGARGSTAAARRSLRNLVDGLKSRDGQDRVRFGEGLTVAELRHLARLQIGFLEGRPA